MGLLASCEANVINPGMITADSQKMIDIVRRLSAASVVFYCRKQALSAIESGSALFHLAAIRKWDVLKTPELPKNVLLEVDVWVLCSLFSKTLYTASRDESAGALGGVLLQNHPGKKLVAVATDRCRLAEASFMWNDSRSFSCLLSRRTVAEILRVMADEQGDISFYRHYGTIFVRSENYLFFAREMDVSYPDYSGILKGKYGTKVLCDRNELKSVIRRISIMSDPVSKLLVLEFRENGLWVSSILPKYGKGRERVYIEHEGKCVKLGLNYSFLLETLEKLPPGRVCFLLNGKDSGILVESAEKSDVRGLSFIMPMKI
jgi:DNA polymerase-3 subunit beta